MFLALTRAGNVAKLKKNILTCKKIYSKNEPFHIGGRVDVVSVKRGSEVFFVSGFDGGWKRGDAGRFSLI